MMAPTVGSRARRAAKAKKTMTAAAAVLLAGCYSLVIAPEGCRGADAASFAIRTNLLRPAKTTAVRRIFGRCAASGDNDVGDGSTLAMRDGSAPIPVVDGRRRRLLGRAASFAAVATAAVAPRPSHAASSKSRTDGYAVQRTEREWSYILSGAQYNILREGGTERPYSSILEGEDRAGTYVCAGCGTELFDSEEKFHSGTGWPSFAKALDGVEVEQVSAVQASLLGAELRCSTCGGHLGDVFNDGMLFVGTPAFKSGKRFCIDGAALVFKPADRSDDVIGDTPPPRDKAGGKLPGFLEPPKIATRER